MRYKKLIKKGKKNGENQTWKTANSKRLQSFFKKCECTIFTRITRGTYFHNQPIIIIVHSVSIKSYVKCHNDMESHEKIIVWKLDQRHNLQHSSHNPTIELCHCHIVIMSQCHNVISSLSCRRVQSKTRQ